VEGLYSKYQVPQIIEPDERYAEQERFLRAVALPDLFSAIVAESCVQK
jgi:hypothetical protein